MGIRIFFLCSIEFWDGSSGEGILHILHLSPHASILRAVWYFAHDYTTNAAQPLLPPHPHSFASADDISKEWLAPV